MCVFKTVSRQTVRLSKGGPGFFTRMWRSYSASCSHEGDSDRHRRVCTTVDPLTWKHFENHPHSLVEPTPAAFAGLQCDMWRRPFTIKRCRRTMGQSIQLLLEQTDFDFTVRQCLLYLTGIAHARVLSVTAICPSDSDFCIWPKLHMQDFYQSPDSVRLPLGSVCRKTVADTGSTPPLDHYALVPGPRVSVKPSMDGGLGRQILLVYPNIFWFHILTF